MKVNKASSIPATGVVAIHPNWNFSERCGVVISDKRSVSEFEKAWDAQPMEVHAEFGFDLPLWGVGEMGPAPRRSIVRTFAQYVALVKGAGKENAA